MTIPAGQETFQSKSGNAQDVRPGQQPSRIHLQRSAEIGFPRPERSQCTPNLLDQPLFVRKPQTPSYLGY